MNKTQSFIKQYLTPYLLQCRTYNPLLESEEITPVPPTSRELEMLVSYLLKNGVDFAIVGSVAVARYLELTKEDIHLRNFRPTHSLEVLITNTLPSPPKGWRLDEESMRWFSLKNSHVRFVMSADIFPQEERNIGKDPESVAMGCPVADLLTLFKMKLNSDRVKDMSELVTLIRKVGFPDNLESQLWSANQVKRLELIKNGLKFRRA